MQTLSKESLEQGERPEQIPANQQHRGGSAMLPVVVGGAQLPPWAAPASPAQLCALRHTQSWDTQPQAPDHRDRAERPQGAPHGPQQLHPAHLHPTSPSSRSCTDPKHGPISHGPKAHSSLGRERRSPAAGSCPRTVSEGPCSANSHSRGRWGHGRSPLPVPRHPQRLAMSSRSAAAPAPLSGSGGPACTRQKLD